MKLTKLNEVRKNLEAYSVKQLSMYHNKCHCLYKNASDDVKKELIEIHDEIAKVLIAKGYKHKTPLGESSEVSEVSSGVVPVKEVEDVIDESLLYEDLEEENGIE